MNIEDSLLFLPISSKSRQLSRSLADQHSIPSLVERVRRNTLAVLVIHDYLEMMGVTTNLETSDCWNPVVQICADIADLEIEGVGKLECRSLLSEESICYVPAEVWADRIGYVVVQFDADWRSASLLGFIPQVSTESIAIECLEPIENLLVAIKDKRESTLQNVENNLAIANLSNWLQNLFESGWQELETLLSGTQPQLAWRTRQLSSYIFNDLSNQNEVRRGKLLDFGFQLSSSVLALLITISPIDQTEINIRLTIHSIADMFLPEFLKLVVIDDSGNIFLTAEARSIDNYIQLQFSGSIGEQFSVQVSLGEFSLVENFII